MKLKNILMLIVVISACLFSRLTFSFELMPSEKKIQKAVSTGTRHFMDIFESGPVKAARFGHWPDGDGGIIESKLIYLSIISSMRVRARMPEVSKEKIESVMNSKEMPIRISSSMNVFDVVIKQDGRSIKATHIDKAMQMPPALGEGAPQSMKAFFNYDDIDTTGKATIVFYEDFGEIEFPVDFSKFD